MGPQFHFRSSVNVVGAHTPQPEGSGFVPQQIKCFASEPNSQPNWGGSRWQSVQSAPKYNDQEWKRLRWRTKISGAETNGYEGKNTVKRRRAHTTLKKRMGEEHGTGSRFASGDPSRRSRTKGWSEWGLRRVLTSAAAGALERYHSSNPTPCKVHIWGASGLAKSPVCTVSVRMSLWSEVRFFKSFKGYVA